MKAGQAKPAKIRRGIDVPYANQYLLDPRAKMCWDFYIDPKSETFSNALRSAIRAGFSENYSRQITDQQWWTEKIRRLGLLSKAERNLEQALDLPVKTQAIGAFGPLFAKGKRKGEKGAAIMTHNVGLIKIRTEAAEFVAERVGKARYSKKETDPGNIYNIIVFNDGQRAKIAKRIIGGGSPGDSTGEGTSH